jgi:hypothetical protein
MASLSFPLFIRPDSLSSIKSLKVLLRAAGTAVSFGMLANSTSFVRMLGRSLWEIRSLEELNAKGRGSENLSRPFLPWYFLKAVGSTFSLSGMITPSLYELEDDCK